VKIDGKKSKNVYLLTKLYVSSAIVKNAFILKVSIVGKLDAD